MLIHQAIYEASQACEGLTDLVGANVYHSEAPQDVIAPYVVFFIRDNKRHRSHGGSSGIARTRLEFEIFGDTELSVANVIEQLSECFDNRPESISGITVDELFQDNDSQILRDEETRLYTGSSDFILWYHP